MLKEFRTFINRGNVIDLAVAVVMGTAFSSIVTSLVNDIMMPPMKLVTQWLNVSTLALRVGGVQIAYGNFLQTMITFLLIAWVSFLLVRMSSRMQKQWLGELGIPPTTGPTDTQLLTDIRDLLKARAQVDAREASTPLVPSQTNSVDHPKV